MPRRSRARASRSSPPRSNLRTPHRRMCGLYAVKPMPLGNLDPRIVAAQSSPSIGIRWMEFRGQKTRRGQSQMTKKGNRHSVFSARDPLCCRHPIDRELACTEQRTQPPLRSKNRIHQLNSRCTKCHTDLGCLDRLSHRHHSLLAPGVKCCRHNPHRLHSTRRIHRERSRCAMHRLNSSHCAPGQAWLKRRPM